MKIINIAILKVYQVHKIKKMIFFRDKMNINRIIIYKNIFKMVVHYKIGVKVTES